MKTIPFKGAAEFFTFSLKKALGTSQDFFLTKLYPFVDREVKLTWRSVGPSGTSDQKIYNRTTWKGYSMDTLHPLRVGKNYYYYEMKKWNTRTGTDGSKGKYSAASIMNSKSGLFRRSFTIQSVSPRNLLYGSNHPLAHKLLTGRPVINYDDKMMSQFKTLFSGWVDKAIRKVFS